MRNSRLEREYIVDSGASFHIVPKASLTPKERNTSKKGESIAVTTANGEVHINTQVRVYVHELCIFVWAYLLKCDVAILSLGPLCDEDGFTYLWEPGCSPTLSKQGLKVECRQFYNVPVIFPTIAEPGGSAVGSGNRYSVLEDDETDEDMPDICESSSDEEGWERASGRIRNKPNSFKKVKGKSRP